MVAVLLGGVLWGSTALPAAAQQASPRDLLVVPDGARLVTTPGDLVEHEGDTFLEGAFLEGAFPDLEVDVQGQAIGAVQRGDEAVLVTVVRLGSARQASEALAEFGTPSDPVEGRPPLEPDTVARLVRPDMSELGLTGTFELFEAGRATGADLVAMAQVAPQGDGPSSLMRDTMAAHVAAFPTVTPPSHVVWDEGGWEYWKLGAGLLAAVGLTTVAVRRVDARTHARRGRRRGARSRSRAGSAAAPPESRLAGPPPASTAGAPPLPEQMSPPGTTSASGARVIW